MRTVICTATIALCLPIFIAATRALAQTKPDGANVTEVKAVDVTAPAAEEEAKPAQGKPADAKLGLSVAGKVGATLPTSGLGLTYFVGAEVGYRLPLLERLLGVAVEFSAGEPTKAGTLNAPAAGGDVKYDLSQRLIVMAFEANAQVAFDKLSLYGGAGYGVYFLKETATAFAQTNTESQTRAGLQLRGGAGYRLGPGDIFAELRYHYVGLKFLATGSSNAGGVTLGVGYRYGF
jgi:hypothetical protein